jgi:hypothetical protein
VAEAQHFMLYLQVLQGRCFPMKDCGA